MFLCVRLSLPLPLVGESSRTLSIARRLMTSLWAVSTLFSCLLLWITFPQDFSLPRLSREIPKILRDNSSASFWILRDGEHQQPTEARNFILKHHNYPQTDYFVIYESFTGEGITFGVSARGETLGFHCRATFSADKYRKRESLFLNSVVPFHPPVNFLLALRNTKPHER